MANILAIDYGSKWLGLALADRQARLPRPIESIQYTQDWPQELETIIHSENVVEIVVGLPLGMAGQETAQTHRVREFAAALKVKLSLPVSLQDETLTSLVARNEAGPKPKFRLDSYAAATILRDYLTERRM